MPSSISYFLAVEAKKEVGAKKGVEMTIWIKAAKQWIDNLVTVPMDDY